MSIVDVNNIMCNKFLARILQGSLISTLIQSLLIFISGCGGGGGGGVAAPIAPVYVPVTVLKELNQYTFGEGITSPYKIVRNKKAEGQFLAINGGGESGGTGYLYVVDAETFEMVGTPLKIGNNPSDIQWYQDYLLVSCRGSSEVYFIDVDKWTVVDVAATVASPISIAVLPGNKFAIVSIVENIMELYSTAAGRIQKILEKDMGDVSYRVLPDPSGNYLYVNHVGGNVLKVVSSTLRIIQQYATGNTPSFGSLIKNNHLLATDREGYIHNINLETGQIQSLDLCIPLGLNRNSLPLRGIEPTDIIGIGNNKVLIVNSRQNSVVLTLEVNGTLKSSADAIFGGGSYAEYLEEMQLLMMTRPSMDVVARYNEINADSLVARPSETRISTGVRIKSAAGINGESGVSIVVMDSAGIAWIFNHGSGETKYLEPPAGYKWDYSVNVDDNGNGKFAVAARSVNTNENIIVIFDADGQELDRRVLTINKQLYSIDFVDDIICVVSRLYGQVEIVDLTTFSTTYFSLAHARPRQSTFTQNSEWVVVHDTNPDIGYSYNYQGRVRFFNFDMTGWASDIQTLNDGKIAISSFSPGYIYGIVPSNNTRAWSKALSFSKVEKIVVDPRNNIWAISPTSGQAAYLNVSTMNIELNISIPNVIDIIPDLANDVLWAVTEDKLILYSASSE